MERLKPAEAVHSRQVDREHRDVQMVFRGGQTESLIEIRGAANLGVRGHALEINRQGVAEELVVIGEEQTHASNPKKMSEVFNRPP
ncbi:MAG: hypothetical protein V3V17_11860 [Alphaproteobacteria bacterium]|nr:hypothetical protein [Pseudomonadota bacterium]